MTQSHGWNLQWLQHSWNEMSVIFHLFSRANWLLSRMMSLPLLCLSFWWLNPSVCLSLSLCLCICEISAYSWTDCGIALCWCNDAASVCMCVCVSMCLYIYLCISLCVCVCISLCVVSACSDSWTDCVALLHVDAASLINRHADNIINELTSSATTLSQVCLHCSWLLGFHGSIFEHFSVFACLVALMSVIVSSCRCVTHCHCVSHVVLGSAECNEYNVTCRWRHCHICHCVTRCQRPCQQFLGHCHSRWVCTPQLAWRTTLWQVCYRQVSVSFCIWHCNCYRVHLLHTAL